MTSGSYERIYEAIRRIPEGHVATYGQIARVAGLGGHARLVGYALSACDEPLPWHRVINAWGQVSRRADPSCETLQREMLEKEGVAFDDRGRVSLVRFQWNPEGSDPGDAWNGWNGASAREAAEW